MSRSRAPNTPSPMYLSRAHRRECGNVTAWPVKVLGRSQVRAWMGT